MGVAYEVDGPWLLPCLRLPPAKAELHFKWAILPCLGTQSCGVAAKISLLRTANTWRCWLEELLVQLGCIDIWQWHWVNSTSSGSWELTLRWAQSSALGGTMLCFWSLAPWWRFPFAVPTLAGSCGLGCWCTSLLVSQCLLLGRLAMVRDVFFIFLQRTGVDFCP